MQRTKYLGSAPLALILVVAVPLVARTAPPAAKPGRVANEDVRDSASRAYEAVRAGFEMGIETPEEVYRWSFRWMGAERAVSTSPHQEVQMARSHLQRMHDLSKRCNRVRDWPKVDYYLTEAESLLASIDPREKERYERMRIERKHLQGTWKVQSETVGGKPVEKGGIESITIRGRIVEQRNGGRVASGFLTINPSAVPKTFDIYGFNEDFVFHVAGSYRLADDVCTINLTADHWVTLIRMR